ncbi:sulfatase [Streptomyces sp. GC420]|nr:sulfatase [Streptomyces sp. GC420]
MARVTTGLAALLVLVALLLPNNPARLSPGAFLRIPAEAIIGAVVLLHLPPRAMRWAAAAGGLALGLVTIMTFFDIGFYEVLDRPFDPVIDWILLDDAQSFLTDSIGSAGATGVLIGAVLLALALTVLLALAAVRLSGLLARHRARAPRTLMIVATVWITCAAIGAEIAGTPLASKNAVGLVRARAHQVSADIDDRRAFAKESAVDAFRGTPADQLVTRLRGKDVIFAFIESYGRSAIEDPRMAKEVGAVLEDGNRRLREAGFSSKSGFLTSPTVGAGSWLAHSTFMSGLWIKNQQRYDIVTKSDRLSLTGAFRRTEAWRTAGFMPGVTKAWPESKFYGLDHVYDFDDMGYAGPKFSWSRMPDQYTLSAFERLENSRQGREPLMTEIILTSSHKPWAPLPRMIDWDEVGDGSVYNDIMEKGKNPTEVWQDSDDVRTEYRRSIEYSLTSLIEYVEKYGDENTVLVFLGDHQPAPVVTGENASRDVPIAMVAKDPEVLDRISDWGWHDGLKPGPDAPVWPMDSFRDRFLSAYGPQPDSASSPGPSTR